MPIYAYLCRDCNRIFEFMFGRSSDARKPRCPRCDAIDLQKQLSEFAFVRGGKNPLAAIPEPKSELHESDRDSEPPPEDKSIEAPKGDSPPVKDDGLYNLWEHHA